MSQASGRVQSPIVTIFAKELRDLLRDRRAALVAFVLPLFLHPVMFWGLSILPRVHKEELEAKMLRVGFDGDSSTFRKHVTPEDGLEVSDRSFREEEICEGELAVFVEMKQQTPAESGGQVEVVIRYVESSAASREALRRVQRVFDRIGESALEERFAAHGIALRVDEMVTVHEIDVSTRDERSVAILGRILPLLLVILLLTGGSFAALDLVAGEKERGTLETLCVQAVTKGYIVAGKFLVILAASILSVVLNLAGLLAAFSLGLAPPGLGGEPLLLPSVGSLLFVVILIVPLAVLSSAILLGLSAYARSYREAQTYLFPVTLISLIPLTLAVSPHVTLSSVVAVVPVANVAVAIREVLAGSFAWIPVAVAFASTSVYAILALRKSAALLEREEVLLGLDPPLLATDVNVEARERRGFVFGATMLLIVYFAASWLQTGKHFSFLFGLALTLWGVVLVPALVYPLMVRRGVREVLALYRPRLTDILLVVPMAAASSVLAAAYVELQNEVLPFPEELGQKFAEMFRLSDIQPVLAFLLFAVSPGIIEELLWRGAFQSELNVCRGRVRAAVLVGVFFGIFHLSIYRFVPTAVLGTILAVIRLRTGSIFPCMVFHAAFNAVSLFLLPSFLEKNRSDSLIHRPLFFLGALCVLALGFRLLRPSLGRGFVAETEPG